MMNVVGAVQGIGTLTDKNDIHETKHTKKKKSKIT